MERRPDDFWRTMQDLSTRAVNEQARLWDAYVDLWLPPGRTARRDAAPTSSARALSAHTTRYVREAVNLTADYYRNLYDLGRAWSEGVGAELGIGRGPARGADSRLELSGAVGASASATFDLANQRSTPMEVDLGASPFEGPRGGFEAAVDVVPRRFTLQPGEERSVRVTVTLDPALFQEGASYTATLSNRGDDGTRVALSLRALPPEATPVVT